MPTISLRALVLGVASILADKLTLRLLPGWMKSVVKIHKTFAVDQSVFTGVPIEGSASFPPYDGCIYHCASPRNARQLSAILSESFVDYILDHIDLFKDSTKEFYRGSLDTWLYYLFHRGSGRLVSIGSWQCTCSRWSHQSMERLEKIYQYLILLRICQVSGILNDAMISFAYLPKSNQPGIKYSLKNLSGSRSGLGMAHLSKYEQSSIWMYINRYRKPIVVENLIHLLWRIVIRNLRTKRPLLF